MIVQVLLSRRSPLSVLIEEPEVHLHPRLTAHMAQLMVDVLGWQARSQVLCESHAPEIVLRVANCVLSKEIAADAAQVLFIEKIEGSSNATSIGFYEDGSLTREWPDRKGFFPEREYEIQSLVSKSKADEAEAQA